MNKNHITIIQDESKNIIKVHKLGKRFRFLWALKNISLTFEKNTITGIIGPNGAGKSTLLNLIGTIITPTTGSITIFEHDIKLRTEKLRKNI
ncbi:MAG: ATP-binding cassette domain-containing protein, partial [Candidatus Hodarchaeales archaeon]